MKFASLAAAFCGVALISGSAQAAFTYSTERSSISSSLDRVVLYALSDTTANAKGADIRVTSPTANAIKFTINTEEGTVTTPTSANPAGVTSGSRINSGVATGFLETDPDHADPANYNAYSAGLSNFYVSAANTGGSLAAGSTANGGKGALIFSAVVLSGSTVTFTGEVGDTSNVRTPLAITNSATAVPEPTALAFVGLGALGLMSRRARRA